VVLTLFSLLPTSLSPSQVYEDHSAAFSCYPLHQTLVTENQVGIQIDRLELSSAKY